MSASLRFLTPIKVVVKGTDLYLQNKNKNINIISIYIIFKNYLLSKKNKPLLGLTFKNCATSKYPGNVAESAIILIIL